MQSALATTIKMQIRKKLTLQESTRSINHRLIYCSLFFVFITVYIKLWTPINVNRWPEAIYTLTFFYGLYMERTWLLKHPMVLGLIAAVIATPLLFIINYIQDPILAVKYVHLEKLVRIYLFIPVGYWLSFEKSYCRLYIGFAFLGFITACLISPNLIETTKNIFLGVRVDFGLQNWQYLGLWSGLFLINYLYFLESDFKNNNNRNKYTFSIRTVYIISISISIFGLIAAQTRASILGLFFAVAILIYVKLLKINKNSKFKIVAIISTFFCLGGIISLLVFTNNTFKERFTDEEQAITAILSGDLDRIPVSSIGVRIHSWHAAIDWVAEKPIVGWGGYARGDVINDIDAFPPFLKDLIGHLHNSYLEFLVAYGVIGLAIVLWPFIWAIREDKKSSISITTYASIYFLVMCIFESYLFFWSGTYTMTLILAPILASSISNKQCSTRISS